ncbi:hypothetical protein [Thauera humireducens]|uniref:hypothetical protein n=1 Tax=Thauera humireducens TaxID=1134435 RepID=UPI00311EDB0A
MRGIGSSENVAGRDPAREPVDFIGIDYAIDNRTMGGASGRDRGHARDQQGVT